MKRNHKMQMVILGILCILGCFCIVKASTVFLSKQTENLISSLKYQVFNIHCPYVLFADETKAPLTVKDMGKELVNNYAPIYEYLSSYPSVMQSGEDAEMIEKIILSEGRDENHSPTDLNLEGSDGQGSDQSIADENSEEIDGMLEENRKNLEDKILEENTQETAFEKATEKTTQYEGEKLKDFDYLFQEFYSMHNTTSISAEQLNADSLLGKDMCLQGGNDKPQILIYHTHSQEAFADSIPGDKSTTIVGAGEKLANLLADYGFNVIHHTGEYDVQNRDYAYTYAAPAIEGILEQYPSIEVIIDMHRDGVAEGTRLVTELDGRPTAQFMFFNGLSRTTGRGEIAYLKNENLSENLAFSFQAQLKCKEYYPNLARRIYLKGYRYNMHFRGKSMLVEIGAQNNTVEEIMNAIDPLAHVLYMTLSGEE